jgi:hypothetical protein
MWNLSDVKTIEYRRGRVFHVTFEDGLEGEVDFSEYLARGPIFEPLKDESYFRAAAIVGGTIAWPNGADIAPESLYERLENARKSSHPGNANGAVIDGRQARA